MNNILIKFLKKKKKLKIKKKKKMKFHLFLIFIINYLIKPSLGFTELSEDCKKLNNFLNNTQEINYCDYDFCDIYGNINKLIM